jgi:hypothetical protein
MGVEKGSGLQEEKMFKNEGYHCDQDKERNPMG